MLVDSEHRELLRELDERGVLLDQLPRDEGEVSWGHNTRIGYFAQDHREGIPEGTKLWEWLMSLEEDPNREEVRQILGRMLFSGDDGEKETHVLSGGETARRKPSPSTVAVSATASLTAASSRSIRTWNLKSPTAPPKSSGRPSAGNGRTSSVRAGRWKLIEHFEDDAAVVVERPAPLRVLAGGHGHAVAALLEAHADGVAHRARLAPVVHRREHEPVGDAQAIADVDELHVPGLAVQGQVRAGEADLPVFRGLCVLLFRQGRPVRLSGCLRQRAAAR